LFTGEFTGQFIWGRGSSDDKSGLVGILYASLPVRMAVVLKIAPKQCIG
jgi:acetylornithine deacetylase/succinyl-diaminopimelate desuccinylase-like protein